MDIKTIYDHLDCNYYEITVSAENERYEYSISIPELKKAVGAANILEQKEDKAGWQMWLLKGSIDKDTLEIILASKSLLNPNPTIAFIDTVFNGFLGVITSLASFFSMHGRYHGKARTHHLRIMKVRKTKNS